MVRFVTPPAISLLLLFGTVCLCAVGEHEAERAPASERFKTLVRQWERGVHGDEDQLNAAIAGFESLLRDRPRDPLVRAHIGSSYAAKAMHAPDLREKQRWITRGFRHLDEAVEIAPDNLRVRLLRATAASLLPRLAGRHEQARADFDLLLDAIEKSGAIDERLAAEIYFRAGNFFLRDEDPRVIRLLRKALHLSERLGEEERAWRLRRTLATAEAIFADPKQ